MNVKELIEFLEGLDPSMTVVMSSDGEGNKYSPLSEVTAGKYCKTSNWDGEVIHPEDIDSYSSEDIEDVAVLYPIN